MATIYIRSDAAFDGDGTAGNAAASGGAAGARNVNPTASANNTYLFRREGNYSAFRPQSLTSAAATPLTIGAYYNDDGTDDTTKAKPLFDHRGGANGVGVVFIDTCTNWVVKDIAGTNSIAAGGAAVRVRRSVGGIIRRVDGYGNAYGVTLVQDQASGTSTTSDILIEDCKFYDNLGSGIHMNWGSVSTARLKNIRIKRNKVWGNGTGTTANTRGGIMCQNTWQTDNTAAYCCFDIELTDNEVFANRSYGVNIYCWRTEIRGRNKIERNHVYNNGWSEDLDSHSLWVGSCFDTDVRFNNVHDNKGQIGGSVGSCVGIFLDFTSASGVGGDNNRVQYNRISNQWQENTGSSVPGSGIHVLANTNCVIEHNLIENCRNGIAITSSGTDGNIVRNNTVRNITSPYPGGHGFLTTIGQNNLIYGNIFQDVRVGLFIASSGTTGTAESYNCVHRAQTNINNGTFSAQTSTTLAASDVTSDPLLDRNGIPALSSPVVAALATAAVQVNGTRRDHYGKVRPIPPSIGACEPFFTRTERTV